MGEVAKYRIELEGALLSNNAQVARDIVLTKMSKMPPMDRVQKVITPVLEEIGTRWWKGEAALAQIFFSSKVCEEMVIRLLEEKTMELQRTPKIAVATLEDYHQLGSKVVRMSIQSTGQKVADYGRMDVAGLADMVCKNGIDYLLVSTLMLRSALKVEELKKTIDAKKCSTKIIVGGAPFRFDWNLWRKVNADFTASSPLLALEYIRREEES